MSGTSVRQPQRSQPSRRRHVVLTVPLLVLALFAVACGGSDEPAIVAGGLIPADIEDTCPVPSAQFDSWFESGEPAVGGPVTAADSVNFPTTNTACDFYKWGAQMFLWLTSPEGQGLVLDGPSIFTVAPKEGGTRQLIANTDDDNYSFALRAQKPEDIGELGQAGTGGVLMSQGQSLVYYGVHVNDVYAYFLTGQKDGQLEDATTFPRNGTDLMNVMNYVDTTFPDVTIDNPNALTMELKTSWVEASSITTGLERFITIQADVPVYEMNSDSKWTATGETTEKTLALTGIHIVGTVQNHPEFIWITYEHMANAPFGGFLYNDASGTTVERAFDASGDYEFMQTNGTESGANTQCMAVSGDMIVAVATPVPDTSCNGDIVASDTYTSYPWGSPSSSASDGDGRTSAVATNNTLLLSLNSSVMGQLAGDVRANYIQTGGIWTSAPSASADAPIPGQSDYNKDDLRGSLYAFNTTMETYAQGTSCFGCHTVSAKSDDTPTALQLSHIYFQIDALPVPPES